MKKNIRVKVEEENFLRLSIPTEEGVIVINNPSKKFKADLVNEMVTRLAKNEDVNEKEIVLRLVNHCTNVEFDGNIFESENLTHDAQMIINEILSILQEIISEAYQLVKLAMQQAKNEVMQKEILNEKDEIIEITERKKEEKEVVEEEKDLPKKNIKKPSRRKGSVNRR